MSTNKQNLFENKVILVTGGASGMGKRAVELFAAQGASVAIADTNTAQAQEICNKLQHIDGRIKSFFLNVTNHTDVKETIKNIAKEFGKIDVAVNAAGIGAALDEDTTTEDIWRRLMSVNLDGVFYSSFEEGQIMRKTGGGKIINFASISGSIVNRLPEKYVNERNLQVLPAYCASKAGVIQLTKVLAAYWAKEGIRVNCISPGFVKTPMTDEIFSIPALYSNILHDTPLNRVAEPKDIDGLLLYLASDDSDFMTGAELRIDGGYTLW